MGGVGVLGLGLPFVLFTISLKSVIFYFNMIISSFLFDKCIFTNQVYEMSVTK